MKKYYPSFYHTSSCFAGHCPDTCCAGWEIPLSEQDKERFRTFIPADYFSDGIIAIDEKGDSCFKLSGGSCPFLNRENLCRIRLDFSHELTPDVCRQYPLFIEEYDTFTECCPSLSCPSVCESIFAQNRIMPVFPDPDYNGEDEFLNSLILTRSKVLSFIEKTQENIQTVYADIVEYASAAESMSYSAQPVPETGNTDTGAAVQKYISDFETLTDGFIKCLCKDCDILTEKWRNMVRSASAVPFDFRDFSFVLAEDNKRFLQYFVYRYWLKSVNDDCAIPYAYFIMLCDAACVHISRVSGVPFSETARLFSKETEHDSDNVDCLLDFVFETIFNNCDL